MVRCQSLCLGLILLAFAWPRPALGQRATAGSPTAERVSRRDAIRGGALHGPGVAPARAPLGAVTEAAAAATRLLRPPMLTLTGGYRRSSAVGPEVGLSIAQDVPVSDLRARRKELARAWEDQAKEHVRQATLEAAARAALAWSVCLEADALWKLRRDAEAAAEKILRVSQVRLTAGTGLPSDAALARSDVATARAATLDGEGGAIDAYAELRLALGKPVDAALIADGSLEADADEEPSGAAPAGAVDNNATVAQARARAQLARSQTELTAATLGPSFVVGAAYLREGGGAQVFTGFVGLPLPLTQPAGFDRARERGLQQRAQADVDEVRSEIAKSLSLAAHDRLHWRETLAARRAGASAAQEALRIVFANFEAGTLDIAAVLVARQRWLNAEEQATHAAGEVQRADIRFDALTGRLLAGVTP